MPENETPERGGKRVLIAGAGTAGQSLAAEAEDSGDTVVGFLDDSQV